MQTCGVQRSFQVSILMTPACILLKDCFQSVVPRSSFKHTNVVGVYHQSWGVEVNKDRKVHDVKYIWIYTYSSFITTMSMDSIPKLVVTFKKNNCSWIAEVVESPDLS